MGRYLYKVRLRGLDIQSAKADFVTIGPDFNRGNALIFKETH